MALSANRFLAIMLSILVSRLSSSALRSSSHRVVTAFSVLPSRLAPTRQYHQQQQQQQQQRVPVSPRFLSSSTSSPENSASSSSVDDHQRVVPEEQDQEEVKIEKTFYEHQQKAPRLDFATDVRTLVQYNHGYAVMSTNSKSDPGYPGGSVVGFAPDEQGRPVFVFAGMSGHTQDITADPRCSVTIAAKEFKSAADGRVNLMGTCHLIQSEEEQQHARNIYLKKHPNAFWVDFGDFKWFRFEVEKVRFVGGFGRAGRVSAEEYQQAKPDPIAAFGPAIAQHMNEDHMDSTIAMIAHQIPGMKVDKAVIMSVDSLGMYIKATRTPRGADQPQQFNLRLPFPRPAADRKDVKTLIVEMTQAAAAAASSETASSPA